MEGVIFAPVIEIIVDILNKILGPICVDSINADSFGLFNNTSFFNFCASTSDEQLTHSVLVVLGFGNVSCKVAKIKTLLYYFNSSG